MKLQFEANQAYQLEAMQTVVDIFKGQPPEGGGFEVELHAPADQLQLDNELLVGNRLALDEDAILSNVRRVQTRFNAEHQKQNVETGETFGGLEVADNLEGMHFSVEMETGTGKTYVYLRTIHELYKTYGFKKFIIVVPSIAIKEGVMKNLQITKEHFALLYNNPEMDFYLYDPKGKFARWFEEIYKEFQSKPQYQAVMAHAAEEVHNGYFSQDKKTGAWKDSMDKGGEGGSSKDDEQAYELIMKDKERLLDINTPLRFIFSHSALREGWDNPNVFQICTLNETHSEVKKRHEIGRGLRLPVNQQGERVDRDPERKL